MKTTTAVLAIGLLALSAPALAQDAAKNAALDRFMKAMNASVVYQGIGNQALGAFAPLAAMNPTRQDELRKIIEAEVVPELRANRPVFERALRAAYSKRFTTAELNAISTFIESPAGQKLRASEGPVLQDAVQSLLPMERKIQQTIGPKVLQRMRAAGMTVPPQGPAPAK